MQRVFHFSGGSTSALMTWRYYIPGDIVIFCDTGREHADTYRFITDFEQQTKIPVIKLSSDWRQDVIVKEQMLPNAFKRKCTLNLKIKKARRYLRSIGLFEYTQFIGFRFDEKDRVNSYPDYWQKVDTVFPLHDDRTTKQLVNEFWRPILWRLQIPPILSNCDLCFLKGIEAIKEIIRRNPSTADKWIDDEENKTINPHGYTYHNGISMRQIRDLALRQQTLFDLEDLHPLYNCTCTA